MPRAQPVSSPVAARLRGKIRSLRARLPQPPLPVILMYHRIADEPFDPWQLAVPPERFAQQLAWLARNRTVLRLADFAELRERRRLPADAVAVTFDDGYACTTRIAVPLLQQHRLPATIFIAPVAIRQGGLLWWDDLQQIVIGSSGATLRLRADVIDIGNRDESDHRWPADAAKRTPRQRAFYDIWSRLRSLPDPDLTAAMAELRSQSSGGPDGSRALMTPGQMRAIRSELIEFGSHALTHSSLPTLSAADKAREISDSASACAELTGAMPLSFAYPYGDHDAESEALVGQAGFVCGCTAESRPVAATDSRFALPRVQVGKWTARQLRVALNGMALGR